MDVHKDIGLITGSIFYLVLIALTISMVFSVIDQSGVEASSSTSWNGYAAATSFHMSMQGNEFGGSGSGCGTSVESRIAAWKEGGSGCTDPDKVITKSLVNQGSDLKEIRVGTGG